MRRVNTLLRGVSHRGNSSSIFPVACKEGSTTVHVVDLFGYEANEVNSLEQLCVNWSALYDCSPCVDLIGGLVSF